MPASASTSTALPTAEAATRALRDVRARHHRVLSAWTLDLLALRRNGILRARWDRDGDATAWWRRAA